MQIQQLQRNLGRSEADLAAARTESAEARRLIVGLGEAFVPEAFAALASGQGPHATAPLKTLSTPEIVAFIVRTLGHKLFQLTAFTRGLTLAQQTQVIERILGTAPTDWLQDPQFAAARREVETMRAALLEAQAARQQAEERERAMRLAQAEAASEVLRLRQEMALMQPGMATSTPALATSDATANPNASGVRLESAKDMLLLILATRGICERPRLADILVREFGIGDGVNHWKIKSAFDDVARVPWVEITEPRNEIGLGSAPLLYRLNEAGQAHARNTLKVEPVPSELDRLLKLHDTAEHVALILAARGLFVDGKYPEPVAEVELYPEPILLDGSKRSEPDLVVTLQSGARLLVECERDTTKNPAQRADKWSKYFTATRGEFYIICPDTKATNQLVNEVSLWQVEHGGKVHVHVTSVYQVLTDPTRFWVYDRKLGER